MKCLMCDKEIESPPIELMCKARQYGKTMTLSYSYFRKMCCSDVCFTKWIKEVKEYFDG